MIESITTEFKREYVDSIKNTVIAFANTDGGTVYIGVDDDGSVCGVGDVDETMLRVTNAVRDSIRPDVTMFIEYEVEEKDGKNVICVYVQRGTARPYYLHNKGLRPEGVYVRQGASTVPATDAAILNMIKETSGDSYESARSINQSLSFDFTGEYFNSRNVDFGIPQMRTLHMIGEDGTYTNLAYLLSDQSAHTIKIAVFEGTKKTVFKDRQELSGSLLKQMSEAFEYIDRYNRTRAEFNGLDRVDMRDYPPEAIREALLNAVVHRDYSFSGSTLISIYDDRIEFVTIGGLVKGLLLEDIKLGISALRNQYLANVFYRLKLIEAYGTGILKIEECYVDCPTKPIIETTNNAFKITLPNTNHRLEKSEFTRSLSDEKERISKKERSEVVRGLCKKNGSVTRRDLQAALCISQATAILVLRELLENGILVKEGEGKNTRYYLNDTI